MCSGNYVHNRKKHHLDNLVGSLHEPITGGVIISRAWCKYNNRYTVPSRAHSLQWLGEATAIQERGTLKTLTNQMECSAGFVPESASGSVRRCGTCVCRGRV